MVRWLIFLGAIGTLGLRIWLSPSGQSQYSVGQKVKITATVTREPLKVYQKEYLVFEGIALEIPSKVDLRLGDRIVVSGTLTDKLPEMKNAQFGLINESFTKIQATLSAGTILQNWRLGMMAKFQRWLPADEAALAAGILLGGSESMSYDLRQAYRRSGMSHVVAASGYNVSVVAGWTILFFGRWLNRRLTILFGIVSIIIYVFLAGGSAAVVRAGIMAVAAWIGQLFGREGDALWLLGVASWAMLLINPEYMGDIGFQLSVAATAGILWFKPSREILASLAAQAATLPLILHHFGNLSVVAPLANLLFLWLVPPIMQLTALGVVVGPANWLAWPLLKLMNQGVTWLSSWSWSSWQVGQISWLWVGGYYLLLVILSRTRLFRRV
ncbi:MAG: ComEC/Rec2 family competence protein [bacterium]|nr:ComEC/Rec2 family competence protein [bacterium]